MKQQKVNRAKATTARIVLVTCPSRVLSRKIARAVVQKRLAACVNVVRGPVESFYRWEGKLESAREHLLIMKCTANHLPELEKEVKRLHSYDVPEFVVLEIAGGSAEYLTWVSDAVRSG